MAPVTRRSGRLVSAALGVLLAAAGIGPQVTHAQSMLPSGQQILQRAVQAERQAGTAHLDEYLSMNVRGRPVHVTVQMDIQIRPLALREVETVNSPGQTTRQAVLAVGQQGGYTSVNGKVRCVTLAQLTSMGRSLLRTLQLQMTPATTVGMGTLNGRMVWVVHTEEHFSAAGIQFTLPVDWAVDQQTNRLLQGRGTFTLTRGGQTLNIQLAAVYSAYGKPVNIQTNCACAASASTLGAMTPQGGAAPGCGSGRG